MTRYVLTVALLCCGLIAAGEVAPQDYQEINGIVCIEAEHAAEVRGWKPVEGRSGQALQDDAARKRGGCTYRVFLSKPGRYYLHMLCRDQGNTETNDCYATLDGERLYGADGTTRPDGIRSVGARFKWVCQPKGPGGHTPESIKGKPVYFLVGKPGWHELRIDSRSKGFVCDKIMLKLDDTRTPGGLGPGETPHPGR